MRSGFRYCFLVALVVALPGCASLSGPTLTERVAKVGALYDQGREASVESDAKKADYKAAADSYERAARNGSPRAAYALAAMYRDGILVEKDEEATKAKAFFWMRDAAVGGWPQAQYETAIFYYEGKGTDPDPAQALEWQQKAGDSGNMLAQRFLGALYLNGNNGEGKVTVDPDAQKAAYWYLRAAQNGDAVSQAAIGSMYQSGKGIERDLVQAAKWNRLAAKKGVAGAQRNLAALYAEPKGTRRNYEQAIVRYKEAYAGGDAQAGFRLGLLYYYAPAPYGRVKEAVNLFTQTESHVSASATMLGVASEDGKGLPQNYSKALSWYNKAAKAGHAEAYAYLGVLYLEGRGAPQNTEEAVKAFQTGSEKGDPKSQRHLADLYAHGHGVPFDYQKALQLCLQAANEGDIRAMYVVGVMYEKALGASRDLNEAEKWYQRAVDYTPDESSAIRPEPYAPTQREAKEALARLKKIKG